MIAKEIKISKVAYCECMRVCGGVCEEIKQTTEGRNTPDWYHGSTCQSDDINTVTFAPLLLTVEGDNWLLKPGLGM